MNPTLRFFAALCVLAVLATGVSYAQTSVTVFGVLDTGLAYQARKSGGDPAIFRQPGTTTSQFGFASGQQSGSRWGLRGEEHLGDGLKVNFVYEAGVDAGTGNASGFSRQSTLGMTSRSLGNLEGGRRLSPGSYAFAGIDPFDYGFDQSTLGTSLGASYIRLSNLLAYSTPDIGGLTALVGWSFDTGLRAINSPEQPGQFGTSNKFRALSTGLRYSSGNLLLAALFDVYYSPSGSAASSVKQWNIGGTYDFKVVKVYAAFGQNIDGRINGTRVYANVETIGGVTNTNGAVHFLPGARTNQWMVGLSAPITADSRLFGSFQQLRPGGSYLDGVSRATQSTASLGATYALSRRTNVYAYYSYMAAPDMYASGSAQVLGVGVRHLF